MAPEEARTLARGEDKQRVAPNEARTLARGEDQKRVALEEARTLARGDENKNNNYCSLLACDACDVTECDCSQIQCYMEMFRHSLYHLTTIVLVQF